MNRILTIITGLLLLSGYTDVSAQAYDGSRDTKLFIGFYETGPNPGAMLHFERGYSDYFSSGIMASYLFREVENPEDFMEGRFFSNFNLAILINFHFMDVFRLGTRIDPYLGTFVGFKGTGLNLGVRYNFAEKIGIFGQFGYNLLPVLFNRLATDIEHYPYRHKEHFSLGMTINF